ncbi:hypothetical protein [Devosia sp.]|uniref:hypothetical protein n=1 Tax=Devosia sp. TaxID=1871048 RepID=UPI00326715DE
MATEAGFVTTPAPNRSVQNASEWTRVRPDYANGGRNMGLLGFITGSKAAPSGVARKPPSELREALLALNNDGVPFLIRDGGPEKVDLVAEWKIIDAKWYAFFEKAGLKRVFKVLMKLDASRGVVRSVDHEFSVEWHAGIPSLSFAASASRGQQKSFSYGAAFGIKEDGSFGKIYEAKFSTGEIKTPLQETTLANGWGWKGVAFGRL